jgi:hypothetical protein
MTDRLYLLVGGPVLSRELMLAYRRPWLAITRVLLLVCLSMALVATLTGAGVEATRGPAFSGMPGFNPEKLFEQRRQRYQAAIRAADTYVSSVFKGQLGLLVA